MQADDPNQNLNALFLNASEVEHGPFRVEKSLGDHWSEAAAYVNDEKMSLYPQQLALLVGLIWRARQGGAFTLDQYSRLVRQPELLAESKGHTQQANAFRQDLARLKKNIQRTTGSNGAEQCIQSVRTKGGAHRDGAPRVLRTQQAYYIDLNALEHD